MIATLRPAVLALAAVLAGCAAHVRPAPPAATVDAGVVHELAGLPDLAARFDRDRARPRLVLLLSPT